MPISPETRCHLAHDAPDRRRARAERRHRGSRTFVFLDLAVEPEVSPPQTLPPAKGLPIAEAGSTREDAGLVPRLRRG